MNEHELSSYKRAGEIAVQIKKYAREIIKPGMNLFDIATAIDDKIAELGAEPAFPVNLSIDEIAAHYTPESHHEFVAKGLLKIDIGIAIDGFIADTAISFDLTRDNKHKDMIELNKRILENIEKIVRPKIKIREVGASAQKTKEEWNEIHKTNFEIIRNLSGHQIGQHRIHAGFTIPNIVNESDYEIDDTGIAIEPFVTTGVGEIYEGDGGGIYTISSTSRPRDRDARKVVEFIKENYKTRPFCKRWLEKAGFTKLNFIFASLVRQKIIYHYPLLIEKSKAPVSQFENTFVLTENKVFITTKEEG